MGQGLSTSNAIFSTMVTNTPVSGSQRRNAYGAAQRHNRINPTCGVLADMVLVREAHDGWFGFKLNVMELGIKASARKKFFMRSTLGDLAILQDNNPAGVAHR